MDRTKAYREYLRLLVLWHRLEQCGMGESEDAEAIRESMDGPASKLTSEQSVWLQNISADLYIISESESSKNWGSIPSQQRIASEIALQLRKQEWHAFLSTYAGLLPPRMRRSHATYIKARAYHELGDHDAASDLMKYAWKLEPGHDGYGSLWLHYCSESSFRDDAFEKARSLVRGENTPVQLMLIACPVAISSIKQFPDSDNHAMYQHVARHLQWCLEHKQAMIPSSVIKLVYVTLATARAMLGDIEEAKRLFKTIVELDPGPVLVEKIEKLLASVEPQATDAQVPQPPAAIDDGAGIGHDVSMEVAAVFQLAAA